MPRKHKCAMEHCDNDAKYIESGLCHNCYSALWYWQNKRKTPTEMIKRQKKLKLYAARMQSLTNTAIGTFEKRKAQ